MTNTKDTFNTDNAELPWIALAKTHLGLSEIRGRRHNSTILSWLKNLNAWWRDDETPWCGVFVAEMLRESNRYVPKHYYRAKAWANPQRMVQLEKPAYGCIVVFNRKGGGHVGFVVGLNGNKLSVLGGNQHDQVCIRSFSKRRVLGYYWPSKRIHGKVVPSEPFHYRYDLANVPSATSTRES